MVSVRVFYGFEVGRPGSPGRGKKGGIESVCLGGAEGGVVSLPELGQEPCPPGL